MVSEIVPFPPMASSADWTPSAGKRTNYAYFVAADGQRSANTSRAESRTVVVYPDKATAVAGGRATAVGYRAADGRKEAYQPTDRNVQRALRGQRPYGE